MPKEQINYEDDAATFSVHWSGQEAGATLQLGITIPRDAIESYIDGLRSGKSSDMTVQWYSPPLSRHEVQRLIQSARRARDAVYGADA